MYNPVPHLPFKMQQLVWKLRKSSLPGTILFIFIGLLATIWFLIRVIPKPSRASYPCMQATAPFMAAFVMYLLSLWASVVAFKKSFLLLKANRYLVGILAVIFGLGFWISSNYWLPTDAGAGNNKLVKGVFPPNQPIGTAVGIVPGRVTWDWQSTATNPNCSNTSNENGIIDDGDDAWFMSKNTNAAVVDTMLRRSLLALTDAGSASESWDALFRFYNINHGKGDVGYSSQEVILIKINCTSAYGGLTDGRFNADLGRTDHLAVNDFVAETNPYVVLAVVRQLVEVAGVPEGNIYIGDPARNVYKEFYEIWHSKYPGIHILGNNLIHPEIDLLGLNRTPVAVTSSDRVFWSDKGSAMPDAVTDKLFTIFDNAAYIINIPTMKAHSTGGITIAAKNHFGSFTRTWALHLHDGLMGGYDAPTRLGYGLYRVQTDIMMHKLLGGKNLLIVVDALYPSDDAQGVPAKWVSSPFNNGWCSSLFCSLDPVAVESVCHDFLRTEYNGSTIATSRPNWDGVDDYLHQAADSSLWPVGIKYDPDNDGILIASLGVHEHWNNSTEKRYSRNLGTGTGIDLFKVFESNVGIEDIKGSELICYPNPTRNIVRVNWKGHQSYNWVVLSMSGTQVLSGTSNEEVDLTGQPIGVYVLKLSDGNSKQNIKISKN